MKVVDLKVKPREGRGRGYRNRLKATGKIPAVVYGREQESLPIQLENRDVKNILDTGGLNTLITLRFEADGEKKAVDAIINEVQFHPYKHEIYHVDFKQISLKDKLTTDVPVRLVGEAPGVIEGGRLEQLLWDIEVRCLPRDIPEAVDVDVSELQKGDSLHVSDLTAPDGVEFVTESDITVATITAGRPVKEDQEEVAIGEEGATETPVEDTEE